MKIAINPLTRTVSMGLIHMALCDLDELLATPRLARAEEFHRTEIGEEALKSRRKALQAAWDDVAREESLLRADFNR